MKMMFIIYHSALLQIKFSWVNLDLDTRALVLNTLDNLKGPVLSLTHNLSKSLHRWTTPCPSR